MGNFQNTTNDRLNVKNGKKFGKTKIQELATLTQAAVFSATLSLGGCGGGSSGTSEIENNTPQGYGGDTITNLVSNITGQLPESNTIAELHGTDSQEIPIFESQCGYIDEIPNQDFGNSHEQSDQLKILFNCIEKEFSSDIVVPLEKFVPRVREALQSHAPNLELHLLNGGENNERDMHIIANLGFIAGLKLVVSENFTPEGDNNFLEIEPYDVSQRKGLNQMYLNFPDKIKTAKVGSYLGSGSVDNLSVLGFNHYGTAVVFTNRIKHHWKYIEEIVADIPYWEEYSLEDYIESTVEHEASHSLMDNSFRIESINPVDFFSEKYHKWFGTGSSRYYNSALNEFLAYSTALQSSNFNVIKLLRRTLPDLENNGGIFEYTPIDSSPHALTYSFFLEQLLLLPGITDVLNEQVTGDSSLNTRETIQEILQLIGPHEAQHLTNMFQLKSDEILSGFQQSTVRKKAINTKEYILIE